MKKILLTSLAFSLLCAPVFSAETSLRDLKKGKSVISEMIDPETNRAKTQLVFMVKATPDKVWKTLTDYEHYTEFMPTMEETKIRSRNDNFSIIFIKLKSPPFMEISYDMKRVYDKENYKITFKKVAGKIKDIDGSWKLESVDDKYTKVTYLTSIDIGLPVPGFVLDYFSKNGLHKLADNIRKRVESGGTWKQ